MEISYKCSYNRVPSLKLTEHPKMDAWNTSFLLGWSILRCYVSFREGKSSYNRVVCHPLILRHTHDARSTYPLNQSIPLPRNRASLRAY